MCMLTSISPLSLRHAQHNWEFSERICSLLDSTVVYVHKGSYSPKGRIVTHGSLPHEGPDGDMIQLGECIYMEDYMDNNVLVSLRLSVHIIPRHTMANLQVLILNNVQH